MMRTRGKLRCISLVQIVLAVALFPVWFLRVGPWPGAMTPAEFRRESGVQVPEHWRAVVVGGGTYSEWPYGTIRDNPCGFLLWAGLLFSMQAVLVLSAVYAARLKARAPGQPRAGPPDPGEG